MDLFVAILLGICNGNNVGMCTVGGVVNIIQDTLNYIMN